MLRIFTLLALALTTFTAQSSPDLQSMIDAERAFAARARVVGIRDSFLEFFTPDAIALVPGPQSWVDRLKSQAARPFEDASLEWEPRAGDIAASGDFGWLTGPSTYIDRAEGPAPAFGNYLSIWKRTGRGPWKVFIDVGSNAPSEVPFPPGFTQMGLADRYAGAREQTNAPSLVAADKALNVQFSEAGMKGAFDEVVAPESRMHRRGALPRVGRTAILEYAASLDTANRRPVCTWGGSGAASTSDLGYSYGLCTAAPAPEPQAYIRVWARDAAGKWKLVVDGGLAN
jgi:ketosteroid isomerase-like protein